MKFIKINKMDVLVVNAFIRKNNRLLVVRRKSSFFKGMLAFPGGRVEENEPSIKALQREVHEETGYKIEITNPASVAVGNILMGNHKATIELYKAKVVGGKKAKQEEEIDEIDWVKPNDFLDSLKSNSYPKEHVKKIKEFLVKEGMLLC